MTDRRSATILAAGLTDAQRQTVADNLGLIGFAIGKFCRQLITGSYTEDDAWQDGYFGLVRAVQKWDPERARLSTVAMPWIRQAIQMGRGHHEGSGYRRAQPGAGGNPADWSPALSTDRPLSEDGELTLLDLLVAGDDPEAAAMVSAEVAEVLVLAARACEDDLDRAALLTLIDDRSTPRQAALARAAEHGVSYGTMLARREKVIGRIRSMAAAA